MNSFQHISSPQNPLVKELVSFQKASNRQKSASFLIEGEREIIKALNNGYQLFRIISNADHYFQKQWVLDLPDSCNRVLMSKDAFARFAYRERIDNVVALAGMKSHRIENIKLAEKPLVVVLEGIEKPGNIGAVLRTCDAAGVDALFICDPKTDIYNPNVVRSSLGCLFTQQIIVCSLEQMISFCRQKGIKLLVSHLDVRENFFSEDLREAIALVLGSEANGVSKDCFDAADKRLKIPMRGEADSMNVSNAAAIMIYEALRQRKYAK
jgi:TrmH family RNA methyltransferase